MFPNPTPPEDDGPPPTPVDVPGWTAARNAYLVSIGRHTGDPIPDTPPPSAAEEDDDELPPSEPVVEPPPLPNPVTGRGNPDALDPKEAAKARRREYAKAYYRRNRDRILQKAKARYHAEGPEAEIRRKAARFAAAEAYDRKMAAKRAAAAAAKAEAERQEAIFQEIAGKMGFRPANHEMYKSHEYETKKRKEKEYRRRYREKKKAGLVYRPGEWVKPS